MQNASVRVTILTALLAALVGAAATLGAVAYERKQDDRRERMQLLREVLDRTLDVVDAAELVVLERQRLGLQRVVDPSALPSLNELGSARRRLIVTCDAVADVCDHEFFGSEAIE
jgi:hypothetical protein